MVLRLVVSAIGFVVGCFGAIVALSIPLGVLSGFWQSDEIGLGLAFLALIVVFGALTASVFWRLTAQGGEDD